MSNYSSFKKQQLLVEGWRNYYNNEPINEALDLAKLQNGLNALKKYVPNLDISLLLKNANQIIQAIRDLATLDNKQNITNLTEAKKPLLLTFLNKYGLLVGGVAMAIMQLAGTPPEIPSAELLKMITLGMKGASATQFFSSLNGYQGAELAADVFAGMMTESIEYHIKNNISFKHNVYRAGSDKYFEVISEARRLYNLNKLTNLHEDDIEMFEETHLGEWGIFEGQKVPLDFPMLNEEVLTEEEKKKHPLNKPMKNTGGGKKWKVYVRSKSGGIKKVTYGDAKGGLKGNWNNPEAKKSFAARHDCKNKKDKTTSGYWACRANKDWGGQTSGYW